MTSHSENEIIFIAARAEIAKEQTIKQPTVEFLALEKAIVAAKADSKADISDKGTKTPAMEGMKNKTQTLVCLKTNEPSNGWAIKRVFFDDTECKVVPTIETPLVGKRYSIQEAWPLFSKDCVIKDEGTFQFLFPNLECGNFCFHRNGVAVSVGDPEYYKFCTESERWF